MTWISESLRRIELSYLFKNSYIKKDCEIHSDLTWYNSTGKKISTIQIVTHFKRSQKFVTLKYSVSDGIDSSINVNYDIRLVSIPSNLGKGSIYYFECPFTLKKCRVLYLANGSHYFKSRFAYSNQILYKCQVCSKNNYAIERYWKLKDEFEKLSSKKIRKFYKGNLTRSYKRLVWIKKKLMYFDYVRFQNLNKFLSRFN